MELTLKQKAAFGIGAVGKDMVYALSASYVMYYYQDVLGLSASFVGVVLMAARFFDAFNDPFMGVLVAKTRTRWGRFRPWIFSGTLLNALVLYALFAAPVLDEAALMVYFSVVYILWGVTYTMMDIPYWSMIPAVTRTPKDRENLSMVGRTCAGVGSALIAMFTMLLVGALGGDSERAGFRWVALIVAAIFAVTELVCCISMKETTPSEMKTATVKEMFSALFRNDQAMVVVGSIVLINSALYLTSNFIIYFFKYDLGGAGWKATYTLFSTVGGAAQLAVPVQLRAVGPCLVAVHEQTLVCFHRPRHLGTYRLQRPGGQVGGKMHRTAARVYRGIALPHTAGSFRVPVQCLSHGALPPRGAVR